MRNYSNYIKSFIDLKFIFWFHIDSYSCGSMMLLPFAEVAVAVDESGPQCLFLLGFECCDVEFSLKKMKNKNLNNFKFSK